MGFGKSFLSFGIGTAGGIVDCLSAEGECSDGLIPLPKLLSLFAGSRGGGGRGGTLVDDRAGLSGPGQRFIVPWLPS